MELGLTGRRALVTGASRGIGRAIAEGLAAEGCNLVLVARAPDRIAGAGATIRTAYPVQVDTIAADLSVEGDVANVAATAGNVDILINNAGAIPSGSIEDLPLQRWHEAWSLKVFGYIALTRLIYPQMVARGSGVVLNVIGAAGERPVAAYIAGSSGNAALYALTRALGAEGFDRGVRVAGLSPGQTETDRQRLKVEQRARDELGDAARWTELARKFPGGRMATPREVADVAVFLVSDRASYVSGTVVTVDGGQSSRPPRL